MDERKLLFEAIKVSFIAGDEILRIYSQDFDVEFKDDHSPLTLADKNAHKIIEKTLSPLGYPILSEEGKSIPYSDRQKWNFFWMVDPLDGTKEFVLRNDEFTVNIAFLKNGLPLFGVVYAPVIKKLYFGARGLGSFLFEGLYKNEDFETFRQKSIKLPISAQKKDFFVLASRNHLNTSTNEFLDELRARHPNLSFKSIGSSLKFCLIAEGNAHIYPRLAPTMEWDTAAGHAVLKYAGGNIWQYDSGLELLYNKKNLLNPWFIAERK